MEWDISYGPETRTFWLGVTIGEHSEALPLYPTYSVKDALMEHVQNIFIIYAKRRPSFKDDSELQEILNYRYAIAMYIVENLKQLETDIEQEIENYKKRPENRLRFLLGGM